MQIGHVILFCEDDDGLGGGGACAVDLGFLLALVEIFGQLKRASTVKGESSIVSLTVTSSGSTTVVSVRDISWNAVFSGSSSSTESVFRV